MSNFPAISWREQVILNAMMIRFAQDHHCIQNNLLSP
jgi:hypothetical protein